MNSCIGCHGHHLTTDALVSCLHATVAKQQAAIDAVRAFLEAERPAGVRMRDLPDWDEMMVDTVLLAKAQAALDALEAEK